MHYFILRNIIETTLRHFRCSKCGAPGVESGMVVESLSPHGVDLQATCAQCHTVVHIRAAVHAVGDKMPVTLSSRSSPDATPEMIIKDKDITELSKDLGSCTSLKDLLQ